MYLFFFLFTYIRVLTFKTSSDITKYIIRQFLIFFYGRLSLKIIYIVHYNKHNINDVMYSYCFISNNLKR